MNYLYENRMGARGMHFEDSQGHVMYGDVFPVLDGRAYCIICGTHVAVEWVS